MPDCPAPPQSNAEVARVAAHFDALVKRFGADHRALDYGSRAAQRLRFDVFAEELTFSGRRVLDAGCGMADFKTFLDERGIAADYTGIDASPRMIAEARRLHPEARLMVGDILTADLSAGCDVAIANGIFYLLGARADELLRAIVTRLWSAAHEAVAFTSLSTWAPERTAGEYHADPAQMLAFCRTLTPRVRLRHDYLPHDFAVFLFKKAGDA